MKLQYPNCVEFCTVRDLTDQQRVEMAECLKLAKLRLWDGVGVDLPASQERPICFAITATDPSEAVAKSLYKWIDTQLEGSTFFSMWAYRRNINYDELQTQSARHQWLDSMVSYLEALNADNSP